MSKSLMVRLHKLFVYRSLLWSVAAGLCLCGMVRELSAQDSSEKMRVGIIEFQQENNIGLDNAGRIVAEWVASEIVRVGRFDVSERLSLLSVLQEQDLSLTGILDDASAVEVGKIYGVSGIITGSVMKIGSTISVTGRLIAVETGAVLKTAVVRASNLDQLPLEIEVLANQLSDISRAEFEIARDIARRNLSYLAIGGGLALGWSENAGNGSWVGTDFSAFGFAASVSYTTNRYSIWLQGIPIGDIKNLQVGAAYDLGQFMGLAAEVGFITDDAVNYVEVNYYALGAKFQPRHEFAMKVLFGGSSSGLLWQWDSDDPGGAKEKVDGYLNLVPPATYSVEIIYRLGQRTLVLAKVASASLQEYTLANHADPLGNSYSGSIFFLTLQRELAIGY